MDFRVIAFKKESRTPWQRQYTITTKEKVPQIIICRCIVQEYREQVSEVYQYHVFPTAQALIHFEDPPGTTLELKVSEIREDEDGNQRNGIYLAVKYGAHGGKLINRHLREIEQNMDKLFSGTEKKEDDNLH